MTPIETIGTLALGIVLTLATLGGFLLWVTRSHRVDLTGVRIVRAEEWRSDGRPFGSMPDKVVEFSRRVPVGEQPGDRSPPWMSVPIPRGSSAADVIRQNTQLDDMVRAGIITQEQSDNLRPSFPDTFHDDTPGDSDRPPASIQHGQRTVSDE